MIPDRIRKITHEIASARLLVVTKTRLVRDIRTVITSGVKDIGENTLQEIQKKYDHQLFRELQKNGVRLHYIGHLQTNKIRKIVRLCDVIQSVDSIEKARKVNEVAAELKKMMPIFIEINLTGEDQKHGVKEEQLPSLIDEIKTMPHLQLLGLMCLGKKDDPVETGRIFRTCKDLAKKFGLAEVSMGMSDDYRIAIEAGSTMIRLGRTIFG